MYRFSLIFNQYHLQLLLSGPINGSTSDLYSNKTLSIISTIAPQTSSILHPAHPSVALTLITSQFNSIILFVALLVIQSIASISTAHSIVFFFNSCYLDSTPDY